MPSLYFRTLRYFNRLRAQPYICVWSHACRNDWSVVIGVHTPEFSFEHAIDRVRRATTERKIHYPVVIDDDGVQREAEAEWDHVHTP
ncbi:hypothetical protein [Streptomyces sp. GbtcB7]|uniref:hypothetical protein n=1 Tax=Streptomyces sp. GbtcB7 TaxID=2824752 RepID=UPI001C300DC1|nr:hypothetical protein [Streptomyces sp. GbtcB7]